jgi:ATP-dependent Clp protease ATP-binding subunit ClpB
VAAALLFIQREVETRIVRAFIAGDIRDGAMVTIDADGEELVVRWRNPAPEEAAAAEPVGAAA